MAIGKYFVIGGRGYIGAALFSSIPDGIISFRTASSDSVGFLRLRLDNSQDFVNLSITDSDVVFLTAAISSPDICARDHLRTWAVNVIGTTTFINQVIERGARVIFFSSDTVYGEQEESCDEQTLCSPVGEYAAMKYKVEQNFTGHSNFKAIRLSYVFSSEDKFTRYLIRCAQQNEVAELFDPFYRAIVHRDDVVAGALALADQWDKIPEQIINFGGPQCLSRLEFAECLRAVHLHNLQFSVVELDQAFFHNRPRTIAMTSKVFAKLLGRPQHNLCEAARIEFSKRPDLAGEI